jgi:iron complex transport system substrate-binding protein
MHRTRTLIAASAIAALALTACSGGPDDEEGSSDAGGSGSESASGGDDCTPGEGAADATLPASVETMVGTIDIPEPDDGELTVVALGWSDAEIALALGVTPVGVFDWQGFGEESHGVGPWAADLFCGEEPTVITNEGTALPYESIQALAPDLILNTRSGGDEQEFDRLNDIAPTVYAPEGTAAFGTRWDVQTQLVADALGLSEQGEELVADVQATIDDAAAANPQFEGSTAVSASKFGDQYGAYIAGDARWDIIEELGFTQNPPVLELPAQGFYVPLSTEQVTALDADVAILFPIGYTLEELEGDPALSALSVVQEDRAVFLADTDEIAQAFSAASPLSIPIAIDGIVPQLAEIIAE